jgi:hypothetical protein
MYRTLTLLILEPPSDVRATAQEKYCVAAVRQFTHGGAGAIRRRPRALAFRLPSE